MWKDTRMAWRIAQSVVRGWVDNRRKGRVTGEIVLLGRDEPVRLDLEGDANPDVAGCRIEFTNPKPVAGDETDLFAEQAGIPGDITCSRKCRVLDVPLEDLDQYHGRTIPSHWANVLYVEWFSERNGRVVLETADFAVTISERTWTMTESEALRHAEAVQEAMLGWMDRLHGALDADAGDDEAEAAASNEADGTSMDEFEWERFMKESDRKSERYGELLEKYKDHPDCERIVAREMGWDHIEDLIDADRRGLLPGPEDLDEEDFELPEPDPAAEGRDWVRDDDGRVVHPLALRSRTVAIELWRTCKEAGLVGRDDDEGRDPDVGEMIFQTQCTSAKLAGALNSLADGMEPDGGFVVAYLKRALPFLNGALAAEAKVRAAGRLPADVLDRLQSDLFDIRAGILALMERFRRT